jgi:hypothetical protein
VRPNQLHRTRELGIACGDGAMTAERICYLPSATGSGGSCSASFSALSGTASHVSGRGARTLVFDASAAIRLRFTIRTRRRRSLMGRGGCRQRRPRRRSGSRRIGGAWAHSWHEGDWRCWRVHRESLPPAGLQAIARVLLSASVTGCSRYSSRRATVGLLIVLVLHGLGLWATAPARCHPRAGRFLVCCMHLCPRCFSDDIERLRAHGIVDRMARILGWRVYRCLECGHRFYDRPLQTPS